MDMDKVTHPTPLPISEPKAHATALWADSSSNLCTHFDAGLGLQSSRELWENLNIFQVFPPSVSYRRDVYRSLHPGWGRSLLLDFPV